MSNNAFDKCRYKNDDKSMYWLYVLLTYRRQLEHIAQIFKYILTIE
jgi:hypothetical protein